MSTPQNPYQPQQPDPQGQPSANSYGQYPANPGYGTGPYGAEPASPYGAQPNQPYGQPPAEPSFTQSGYTQDPYAQQPGYGQGYPQAGYGQPDPMQFSAQQSSGYAPTALSGAPVAWGRRAQGWLLDWLLPSFVLNTIANLIVPPFGPDGTLNGGSTISSTVSFLIVALYNGLMTKNGQTPGRRWAKTRLVDERTGQPVQGTPAIIRAVCHVLDNLIIGIGWLLPLFVAKRQTIADMIGHTLVVDASAPSNPAQAQPWQGTPGMY